MLTSKQFALERLEGVSYSEMNQSNPLKWSVFYLNKEYQYIRQTNPMMCKDYFNDMVARYHGVDVGIYGFDNTKVNLNEYGVWLLLTNTTDQFIRNIDRAINPKLGAETGHILNPVAVEDLKNTVLVLIPRNLFNSTYTISFLTLMIRACNAVKDFSSWDKLVTKSKEYLVEQAQWLKDMSFLPPEHLKNYWWWQGEAYNSEKHTAIGYGLNSFIHNNGVFTWRHAKGFVAATQPLTPKATLVESPYNLID